LKIEQLIISSYFENQCISNYFQRRNSELSQIKKEETKQHR